MDVVAIDWDEVAGSGSVGAFVFVFSAGAVFQVMSLMNGFHEEVSTNLLSLASIWIS